MNKIARTSHSHEITRRVFVGRALATAVTAGVPAFLRGQNLNNKLNIAFIGSGGRGNVNLSELTLGAAGGGRTGKSTAADPHAGPHPDENVAVLCDVNQEALDAAGHRFPQAKRFDRSSARLRSSERLRCRRSLHAEHTHAIATYLALTHGKHVYCEKPPCL
jgi:predicted dehydrogenase